MENKTYFQQIQKKYKKAAEYNEELYQNTAMRLNKILYGDVVDFGNGGIINYQTGNIKKLICIDIIFNDKMITDNK